MEENQLNITSQELQETKINFEEFDFEAMEELLSGEIEEMLVDLDDLGDEKELLTNPDSLGKEIYQSIFNQLGAQTGMDLSSDTLIEEYQQGHVGETSQSAGEAALRDSKYQKVRKSNTAASKTAEGIRDDYTGEIVRASDGQQINTDHVVSRKEIYGEGYKKRIRELSGNEVKDLANLEENLKATNESLNKSKSDKSIQEYNKNQEQREKDLRIQNKKSNEKIMNSNLSDSEKKARIDKNNRRLDDKLAADPKRMTKADKEARKAIEHQILKDAGKNVAKDAASAALRSTIMSGAVTLVKTIIDSLVSFFKAKKKSWSLFMDNVKSAISKYFTSLKTILKNSISGGVGSIVNNIMSVFSETLGKVWGFIKTGFSTIKSAIKTLTSPENKDKPLSIRLAEFGKIVTVGLLASATILLAGPITKSLEVAFPILMGMTLPIIGSVTGLIVELILAILGGILTGVVINKINKFIANKQSDMINQEIISKQNELLDKQKLQIAIVKKGGEVRKEKILTGIDLRHKEASVLMQESLDKIFAPISENDYKFENLNEEELDEADYSFEDMQADLNSLL